MLNPYQYMLDIRNNRILFQYLTNAAVHFSDTTGWTIQGYSDHGKTEIYELEGGIIRMTLPIPVPEFMTKDILYKVLAGLNASIEGITTAAEEDGELFIEYHLHINNDCYDSDKDKALIKFVQEREEINQGFASLEKDYKEMQKAIKSTMEGLGATMSAPPPKSPRDQEITTEDLSSLWQDMDDIDKMDDNSDEDPGKDSSGGTGNPGF